MTTEQELENMALTRPADFYTFLSKADYYPSYMVTQAIAIGGRWLSTRKFASFVLGILQTSSDEHVQLECVRALKKHAPWRRDIYDGLTGLLQAGVTKYPRVRQEAWVACKNAREVAVIFQNGPKAS